MMKRFLSSEKGLTLIELLAGLTIASIVSIMVISYLLSGMSSFEKVNKQISQQDEANYVMTMFVNKIYVASKVEAVGGSVCTSTIKVTNRDGEVTTLGFENKHAIMNGEAIHSNRFSFQCDDSKLEVDDGNQTVSIKMSIQDESGKTLELQNKVSYVKVE